jgi:thiol-disulfide isomerase/thioredoxin
MIVANNYDAEIHKVKKDAVLFIHAPWCGHCKDFEPVFKKIAKKMLKNNENIVFGKMDGTANDIPYMYPPLKGYPAIFFLSAYEKYDPIQYQVSILFIYISVKTFSDKFLSFICAIKLETKKDILEDKVLRLNGNKSRRLQI